VSLIIFIIMRIVPGDPAQMVLGERASPAAVARLRESMGLNDPLHVQYIDFVSNMLRGDLGVSYFTRQPVASEVVRVLPASFELATFAMTFAVVVGVAAGIVSATRRYSVFDRVSMIGSVMGISMPTFWIGLLLIALFAVQLRWLPVSGRIDPTLPFTPITRFFIFDAIITGNLPVFVDVIRHLLLPALALGAAQVAVIARMTRSSLLEVIRQDYVTTARAKGLSEPVVVSRHALKNALIPVVTVVGLATGGLMGGAVLTETIFAWPGIGKLLVDAVVQRDIPVVQAVIMLTATFFVLINLIVDLLYGFLDPRVRLS
jgi:peptide/nickel transport system permease protein